MKNVARVFFASWYLIGSVFHVKLGLTHRQVYQAFGRTALLPLCRQLWGSVVIPHIVFFALSLAAFEAATGILILGKGKWVKAGLIASVAFNLFLVQLGLSMPQGDWKADFVGNRLPNLLFAALQLPLFWTSFERSVPEILRARLG